MHIDKITPVSIQVNLMSLSKSAWIIMHTLRDNATMEHPTIVNVIALRRSSDTSK